MTLDITPTASDMSGLVVTALAAMSRDDTLAHWGVPLSTIGGYTPAGMNSGETRKYDEAALWQNAVHFRTSALCSMARNSRTSISREVLLLPGTRRAALTMGETIW